MNEKYMKGTWKIFFLLLKQLRWKIVVWLSSMIGINLIVAIYYPTVYSDEASKLAAAMTMENPAMVAMLGPSYDKEAYLTSTGPFFANEMLLFTALAVAIMSILIVSQATRGDEEAGRLEIVQALAVGRIAYTNSVMKLLIFINSIFALILGFGLSLLNVEGMEVFSNFLYGAILGATGLVFGGITLILAQLFESRRTTSMISLIVLMAAYLIRAIGDVNSEWIALVSPLGWTVRTNVFYEDDWLPVLILGFLTIVVGILAFILHSKRDIGAGIINPRKGNAHANPFLLASFGFIFWMQRTHIVTWTIAIFIFSLSLGYVLGDMETYWKDLEIIEAFIAADFQEVAMEQFIALIIAIMSLIGVIPVVMTIFRLKGEELRNFTENMYSRAVSRTSVLGNYLLLALLVSGLMQVAVVLGLWSGGMLVLEESLSFATIFKATLVYLPAIWLFVSVATLLLGLLPKFTAVIWLYFSYCFFVIYLGNLLDLPVWMRNISVFEHIAQIPLEKVNVLSLVFIFVITLGLTVVGFVGYRKRDLLG